MVLSNLEQSLPNFFIICLPFIKTICFTPPKRDGNECYLQNHNYTTDNKNPDLERYINPKYSPFVIELCILL